MLNSNYIFNQAFSNTTIPLQSSKAFNELTNNTIQKKLPQARQRVKENSRLLPQVAIEIMTEWYDRHYSNPYPSYRDCELLAQRGSITINQVKQWFVNVRRRTQNEFRKTRDSKNSKRKCDSDTANLDKKRKFYEDEITTNTTSTESQVYVQNLDETFTSPSSVQNNSILISPNIYNNYNYPYSQNITNSISENSTNSSPHSYSQSNYQSNIYNQQFNSSLCFPSPNSSFSSSNNFSSPENTHVSNISNYYTNYYNQFSPSSYYPYSQSNKSYYY